MTTAGRIDAGSGGERLARAGLSPPARRARAIARLIPAFGRLGLPSHRWF